MNKTLSARWLINPAKTLQHHDILFPNLPGCVYSFSVCSFILWTLAAWLSGSELILFTVCAQQARAEQEEEFISNTLFKKIQALQKEKETLAVNYEKEEEFLTNDLSRKLMQVNQQEGDFRRG